MKGIVSFLLALTIAVLAGCAGKGAENYTLAQQMLTQGNYSAAITNLEQAIGLEPENIEYPGVLRETRAKYAQKIADTFEGKIAQTPMTVERADELLTELKNYDKFVGKVPAYTAVVSKIEGIRTKLSDTVIKNLSHANTLTAEYRFREALNVLTETARINPTNPQIAKIQGQIEESAINYFSANAETFAKNEEWGKVVAEYKKAIELFPANVALAARLADAEQKNTPAYFQDRSKWYAELKDWNMAIRMAQYAVLLQPSIEVLQSFNNTKRNAALFHLDIAKEAMGEGKLHSAQENVRMAVGFESKILRDKAARPVITQVLQAMYDKADLFLNEGFSGNASVWFERIIQIDDTFADAFKKYQTAQERLKQRVVKKVAIMDFAAPSNNADAGRIISDSMVSYISNMSRPDIKILARDVLKDILKEIEMGQSGLYDVETVKRIGKIKGADIFVQGSVLQYNVDRNRSEGTKIDNVVIGKKNVPNPAYQIWLMSPQPKGNNDNATRLAPPAFLEEEVRQMVSYKVGSEKMRAFISVSFRVVDVEKGEIVISKTMKDAKEVEDRFSEGVAFANIPYDALELPSDSTMLEQVMESLIAQLSAQVIERFSDQQMVYLDQGNGFTEKREYRSAIEKYMDTVALEEVLKTKTRATETARKQIEEITGKYTF